MHDKLSIMMQLLMTCTETRHALLEHCTTVRVTAVFQTGLISTLGDYYLSWATKTEQVVTVSLPAGKTKADPILHTAGVCLSELEVRA